MAITAEQVKNLRTQTGAGMMDCKHALTEAGGDIAKAVEILRKKGLSGLAKRADRAMKEGIVLCKSSEDKKAYVLLELNCETDFVAKNPEVSGFANSIADAMLADNNYGNPAEKAEAKEGMQSIAMKTGENMQIRRGVRFDAGEKAVINSYIHSDNKKGAIVEVSFSGEMTEAAAAELKAFARELAMQSVAMSPKYLRREDVPAEIISKEKEIYRAKTAQDEAEAKAKAEAHGRAYKEKPAEVVEKMLEGRVHKFYQECCLTEQVSIRDNKQTIAQSIKELGAKLGAEVKVDRYACYMIGVE